MKNSPDRESVLYAFAIEANHDRSTLERYLSEYPDLAADLIDLSFELRLNETPPAGTAVNPADPGAEAAWKEFIESSNGLGDAMPGPVSDSYDPEFGTGENADTVRRGIEDVRALVTTYIGDPGLKNIVALTREADGPALTCAFSERQLRIIRFCLNQQLESM
ncbi:MAG: hypothetical protein JWO38_4892 [Gemmataceae bacterium]|nr:hypothetical protein [Gemmataceae bacterium]